MKDKLFHFIIVCRKCNSGKCAIVNIGKNALGDNSATIRCSECGLEELIEEEQEDG